MKRFLILALSLVIALSTFGCVGLMRSDEAATVRDETAAPVAEVTPEPTEAPSCVDEILGDWKIVSVNIGGAAFDPASVGMQSELSFYPNGAGKLKAWMGEDVHETIFTYTASGNAITLLDENNERQDVAYDPETGTIRMGQKDASVEVVLSRKSEEPVPEPEPAEAPGEPAFVDMEIYDDEYGSLLILVVFDLTPGASVRIDFPYQEDYTFTNTGDSTVRRKVKMPIEVFLEPGASAEDEQEITPEIIFTLEDGSMIRAECPSFTYPVRTLSITLTTEYERDGNGALHVHAGDDGICELEAVISDPHASVYIDGTEVPVYEGGVILYDLAAVNGMPTYYELKAKTEDNLAAYVSIIVEP